jgi:nucleotide-binding universal stress UspA family protein
VRTRSILVATDLTMRGSSAVQRAWQLAQAHGASLKMAYLPGRGRDVPDLAEQAVGMDLVVLPHQRERSITDVFRGNPVARLLRECRCPVLMVGSARDVLVLPHAVDPWLACMPSADRRA